MSIAVLPAIPAEDVRTLTAMATGRHARLRFPIALETDYQRDVRMQTRFARMTVLVIVGALHLIAPLWVMALPSNYSMDRVLVLALQWGGILPLLLLAATLQWRCPLNRAAEWIIVGTLCVVAVATEVMLWLSARGSLPMVHAVAVLMPVSVLALARWSAGRVALLLTVYFSTALVFTILSPEIAAVRSGGQWVFEILLMTVMAISAIWAKRIMRRQWAATKLLEMMAYKDGLTGLPNRRAFEEHYDRMRHSLTRNTPSSAVFALIDLDHFKRINDRYGHGHGYGDGVLSEIGLTLSQFARRSTDMAARLGGEEFAVVLYNCDREAGYARLQQLLDDVRQLGIEHLDNDAGVVTCSIGATLVNANTELGEAYHTADEQLYWVKRAGRNGLAFAD